MSFASSRGKRALTRTRVSVATALVLYGASVLASPSMLATHASADHVLLPAGVYTGNEPGALLVQDYGSLQLWRIDAAHRHELNSVARNVAKLQSRAVLFEAGEFDVARPSPVPAAFAIEKGDESRIHLIQFNGPVTDALMGKIQASGALVVASLSGNAYALLADSETASRLVRSIGTDAMLRAVSALPSFYKLGGGLAERAQVGLSPGAELDVTVQIARHAASGSSKAVIESLHRGADAPVWDNRLTKESLRLRITETDLVTIANLPDVFAVEPFLPRRKYDEVQAQIIAGNFDGAQTGPSGIGYRAWLAARAFPTTPASYPIIDVVDDGLGTGVANTAGNDVTFRDLGLAANASRIASIGNCTTDAAGDGVGGHGHINTNIVGGYDPRGDAAGILTPFEDPEGFLRGQGISPYTRLAHTKIFTNAGAYNVSNCGSTDAGVIKSSQDRGAPITSNSWGANTAGNYDDSSEAYDIGTRDGDLVEAGNQPMIHIFAAGNAGSGASTVGSPASGKNMITVGASENDRPGPDESGAWTDGCNTGAAGANNAMDVIGFSSRGPTEGGRTKPEVIAPGTHVQGTASTAPGYNGSSVCDQFRPLAQTVYASSSGTSHSTPAIAGVASLMYYFLQQPPRSIAAPSAALMKAYMMANPTYLTGVSANDTLPSNSQGYGMPNMGAAFDPTTVRFIADQTTVFAATGSTFSFSGGVADAAKPVRIALAWSDAPGAITDTTPQVNDLNLTATINGIAYTGNRFTGANSTAGGGAADSANNYEAIFLPAGTTGPIQITVTAANIAGNGIPNDAGADATDQDFALVCTNCAQTPDFFVSVTPPTTQSCGVDSTPFPVEVGEYNGYDGTVALTVPVVDPQISTVVTPNSGVTPYNSTLTVNTTSGLTSGNYVLTINGNDGTNTRSDTVTLQHSAALATSPTLTAPANGATDVATRPTFTWSASAGATEYVLEVDNDAAFGSIDYTATVAGTSHQPPTGLSGATTYNWRVRALNNCGASTNSPAFTFTTVPLFCSTTPLVIPDNIATGVTGTITVASGSALTDLDVKLTTTHTWIGDLIFTLRHVSTGTVIALMDRPGVPASTSGCSGDNFDIFVDDEGTAAVETSCTNTTPAYVTGGRFTPNAPLSGFDTQNFAGAWELNVADRAGADVGTVTEWCLVPTQAPTTVNGGDDAYGASEDVQLTVTAATGVLANDTGPGTLTVTILTPPTQGTLVGGLASNGSFSYLPASNFCSTTPDTFTYTVSDGTLSDTASVAITVACVNDAPVAVDDAYATTEDVSGGLAIAAPGVLVNDTDADTGAVLTATSATQPANGTVVVGSSGSVTYTPNANFCSATPDTFTYRANDGTANSAAPATVSVTVSCVNDAPTVVPPGIADRSDAEGAAISSSIASNFADADVGQTLTFTADVLPAGLSMNAAGLISGTLAFTANASSPYTVTVTANDGNGGTVTDTFVWTVSDTNQAPTVVPPGIADRSDAEGAAISSSIASNFADADVGQTLTFTADVLPAGLSMNAAGLITGTIPFTANASSPYTVTVTANDGNGGTVTDTFTWTVTNTNQAPVVNDQGFVVTVASANGTAVGTIVSTDSDAGDTRTVSVTGGTGQTVFAVSAAGAITVANSAGLVEGNLTLNVTVTDAGGLSDTAVITISVLPLRIFSHGFEGN